MKLVLLVARVRCTVAICVFLRRRRVPCSLSVLTAFWPHFDDADDYWENEQWITAKTEPIQVKESTSQVNSDEIFTAVAVDSEYSGVQLWTGEAESESVTVGRRSVCGGEAVVQGARLVTERIRHAVCTHSNLQ